MTVSGMETRLTRTVVAAACPLKNVVMDRDAMVDQTVIVVSVSQVFVKVNIVTCRVRYLIYHVVVPTCNDGIRNGDETDVDCGGACVPTKRCREGSRCINPADCTTSTCTSNICQGEKIGTRDRTGSSLSGVLLSISNKYLYTYT